MTILRGDLGSRDGQRRSVAGAGTSPSVSIIEIQTSDCIFILSTFKRQKVKCILWAVLQTCVNCHSIGVSITKSGNNRAASASAEAPHQGKWRVSRKIWWRAWWVRSHNHRAWIRSCCLHSNCGRGISGLGIRRGSPKARIRRLVTSDKVGIYIHRVVTIMAAADSTRQRIASAANISAVETQF